MRLRRLRPRNGNAAARPTGRTGKRFEGTYRNRCGGWLGHCSLHDARVLAIAADENPHFSIFLELENPADPRDRRLELRYRLAGGMRRGLRLVKHAALVGDGKPLAWWLYDEFDVSQGPVPAFTHSILLTGGYEFQLTFFTLSCQRLNFLFSAVNAQGEVDIQEIESLASLPA